MRLIEIVRPDNSILRRIVVSAINCAVWIYGMIFLNWDGYEARVFFTIDIGLFLFVGMLRALSSTAGESFFKDFGNRVYMSIFVFPIAFGLTLAFSKVNIFESVFWNYLFRSNNMFYASIMVINYIGFFIHDFIYTGKYKKVNAMKDAMSTYFVVFAIGVIMGFVLNFSKDKNDEFFIAVGIIIARFGGEIVSTLISNKR